MTDVPGAVGKGLLGWGPSAGDGVWEGDAGTIFVFYDGEGHAYARAFTPRARVPQGPIENLRWRFERGWGPRIRD
jgi:hypothetical protein